MRPYRLDVCEDDKIVRDGICTFCGQILTEEKISHEVARFSSAEALEQMELGGQLIRCHNSYLVNMDHVRRLEKQNFFLDNGKKVPVSRKYLKQCQEKILSCFTK